MHIITQGDKWAATDAMLAKAIATSKTHARLAQWALATYGAHGPLISGCVRSHFPEPVKDRLRRLARKVADCNDKARLRRPYRAHTSSVHKRALAMVKERGTGFYGYIG